MMDLSQYTVKIREDFSMILCPNTMVKLPSVHKEGDRDYSNSADKGFRISPQAKRKIRSAATTLYCDATREQQLNLRFVTFTFPSLPNFLAAAPPRQQDNYLHDLFKKFIDNERKDHNIGRHGESVKLDKYLWVNERQLGEHLKGDKSARLVIHYHCLMRYSAAVDYWFANVRWLNLLFRNGFDIFNQAFLSPRYKELRYEVITCLKKLDYKALHSLHLSGKLKVKVFDLVRGVVEQSIFLQPLDFDKKPIESIEQLSKYLSAYISKDYKPKEEFSLFLTDAQKAEREKLGRGDDPTIIYARRWGASHGLVKKKEDVEAAFVGNFTKVLRPASESVDSDTGEVTTTEAIVSLDAEKVYSMYTIDPQGFRQQFDIEVNGEAHTLVYFPPTFEVWRQIPGYREFFKRVFNYNLT